ncbi:regulatory protein, Fis family [Pseudomonas flavescens]|uniref:Regulatory protein, Fis family n=1 Tax=Phytopseudomonas flavescens TaxID=29435 RepID=A0A1G8DLZ7_9GAMM|nr:sigma-54 dependent transcriptional regulator [Pseudomonas flavescens]SDH58733.1 regulatory protein, Fis family [Pseudomonas flavescens]
MIRTISKCQGQCNCSSEALELGVSLSAACLHVDILLQGETGTGKDTLAKRIHKHSARAGSFVGLNCAAIPESLAESQLFGTTSGAYTGALRARQGYIEAADGGTLYLDEIDSMPLSLQAKLLRVLEERGVGRLGSTHFIPLDLRVIASAQRPLASLVKQGRFRSDLFFRLNAVTVRLPPLRERREQILPLFESFVQAAATSLKRDSQALDPDTAMRLLSHPWPGNVRELQSAAKRFVMGISPLNSGIVTLGNSQHSTALRVQMKRVEKALITDALQRHGGRLEAVAKELSVPRRTLHHRMKELACTTGLASERSAVH